MLKKPDVLEKNKFHICVQHPQIYQNQLVLSLSFFLCCTVLFNNHKDDQDYFSLKVFSQKLNTFSLGELKAGIDKISRATQLNHGSCAPPRHAELAQNFLKLEWPYSC